MKAMSKKKSSSSSSDNLSDIAAKTLTHAAEVCLQKMKDAHVDEHCIRVFLNQHQYISSGQSFVIYERDIAPVVDLLKLEAINSSCSKGLLEQTVVMKLNGGLGTGMGLHGAKSLLHIRESHSVQHTEQSKKVQGHPTKLTFLDITAQQVRYLRKQYNSQLRFMLLNSFNTIDETKKFLYEHYPEIATVFNNDINVLQNQVPKILPSTLEPVSWPTHPQYEWTPPGHGDLFTALYASGKLHDLLRHGYKYLFVSNGDNLGATLKTHLLAYMEQHNLDFVMEVCWRTESDKKGGHLAQIKTHSHTTTSSSHAQESMHGQLLLRELAQCAPAEMDEFQNVHKYTYFNTNNLWINLIALESIMDKYDGILPLPVICNVKHVEPHNTSSPKVLQLETAMGSAISLFANAAAIVVPRERFAPVKTCADLLSIRSDAYTITQDARLVLDERRHDTPPFIELDHKFYKSIAGLDKLVEFGVPSLVHCSRLVIRGPVQFGRNTIIKGEVTIENTNENEWLKLDDDTVLYNVDIKH